MLFLKISPSVRGFGSGDFLFYAESLSGCVFLPLSAFPSCFNVRLCLFISRLWYLSLCLSFTLHWLVCFPASQYLFLQTSVCSLWLHGLSTFLRPVFVELLSQVCSLPSGCFLPAVLLHLQFVVLAFPLAIHPSNRWIM